MTKVILIILLIELNFNTILPIENNGIKNPRNMYLRLTTFTYFCSYQDDRRFGFETSGA